MTHRVRWRAKPQRRKRAPHVSYPPAAGPMFSKYGQTCCGGLLSGVGGVKKESYSLVVAGGIMVYRRIHTPMNIVRGILRQADPVQIGRCANGAEGRAAGRVLEERVCDHQVVVQQKLQDKITKRRSLSSEVTCNIRKLRPKPVLKSPASISGLPGSLRR